MAYDASLKKQQNPSNMNVVAPSQDGQQPMQAPVQNQAPAAAPPASSGMYSKLRSYVKANQPSAQRLGSAVTQNVQKQLQKGQKEVDQSYDQFKQAVDAKSQGLATDEQRAQGVQNVAAVAQQAASAPVQQPAPQEGQPAPAQPQAPAISDEEFQRLINVQYGGPKNLTEAGLYDNVYKNIENITNVASKTQDPTQIDTLIKGATVGKGQQYTAGQKALDSFLFRQDNANVENLKNIGSQVGTLPEELGRIENLTQQYGTGRQQALENFRQEARKQFSDIAGGRQQEVETRVNNLVENWDKLPQYFRDAFTNQKGEINISKLESELLGMGQDDVLFNAIQNAGGVNEFFKATQADADRLVSKDEQAQLARLQALAEMASDYGSEQSGINFRNIYQDAEKAGTQTIEDNLDRDNMQRFIKEAEDRYKDVAKKSVRGYSVEGQGEYRKGRNMWSSEVAMARVQPTIDNFVKQQGRLPTPQEVAGPNMLVNVEGGKLQKAGDVAKAVAADPMAQDLFNKYKNATPSERKKLFEFNKYDQILGAPGWRPLVTSNAGPSSSFSGGGSGKLSPQQIEQNKQKNASANLAAQMIKVFEAQQAVIGQLQKTGLQNRLNVQEEATGKVAERQTDLQNILNMLGYGG